MNNSTIIISLLIGLLLGTILGYMVYSKTVARYDAVTTACVIMNQATDNNLLTPEQAKQLGQLTGKVLHQHYPSVAKKFAISEQQVKHASDGSQCSQFLVSIYDAK